MGTVQSIQSIKKTEFGGNPAGMRPLFRVRVLSRAVPITSPEPGRLRGCFFRRPVMKSVDAVVLRHAARAMAFFARVAKALRAAR